MTVYDSALRPGVCGPFSSDFSVPKYNIGQFLNASNIGTLTNILVNPEEGIAEDPWWLRQSNDESCVPTTYMSLGRAEKHNVILYK